MLIRSQGHYRKAEPLSRHAFTKIATVMGNPLHAPNAGRARRSWVPTHKEPAIGSIR